MSHRLSNQNADSLELLLDTICNVFGGIILMAILVVLQTHSFSQRINSSAVNSSNAAVELKQRTHQTDLAAIQADIQGLLRRKVILAKSLDDNQSRNTDGLLARHEEFVKEIQRVKEREKKALGTLASLERSLKEESTQIKKDHQSLKTETQSLKQSIQLFKKQYAKTGKRFRLPYQHVTRKARSLFLIVNGNRIFPFSDTIHEHITRTKDLYQTIYKPIPGKGFQAQQAGRPSDAYKALLKGHSSERVILQFAASVHNDSFKTFQAAKQYAVEQGFSYRVVLYTRGKGVPVVRTNSIEVE